MTGVILAIDSGTTAVKATIWSNSLRLIGSASEKISMSYGNHGIAEQNPAEIWEKQRKVIRDVMLNTGTEASHIASVGITNQRETVIAWDKRDGRPIHQAISWQDRRNSSLVEDFRSDHFSFFKSRTGLIPDTYFSASKIQWLLSNVPKTAALINENRLAVGTVDSWLVWNLSGGSDNVTDTSNASRTMLFNIHSLDWDHEILDMLGIPYEILPEVIPSASHIADTSTETAGFSAPVFSIIGDQQASLLGHGSLARGQTKSSYGTGAFLLTNTGPSPVYDKNLLTSIAFTDESGGRNYCLEGTIFMAGGLMEWLRKSIKIDFNDDDVTDITSRVLKNPGLYFVNSLQGLGAPYWDPDMRGAIVGLNYATSKEDLVVSAIASIAYRTKDILKAFEASLNININSLRIDGGLTNNLEFNQFLANILGIPVTVPANPGSITARGAAALSLSVLEQIPMEEVGKFLNESSESYSPGIDRATGDRIYNGWQKTLSKLKDL